MSKVSLFVVCCIIAGINANAIINKSVKAKEHQATEKPAFCNGLDCPPFAVLEKGSGYELRRYPGAMWVSTKYLAMTPEDAEKMQGVSFNKLFNYISGENENKEKIAMTAPVVTEVTPGAGPNCESTFVMSFYVPDALQKNAPKPSSKDVYLQNMEQMDVYVKSFGGFASQSDYKQNLMELMQAVGEDKIDPSVYFTAGYDSPFKFWSRHNECAVPKKKSL